MHGHQLYSLFLFLCLTTMVQAQVSDCPWVETVNGIKGSLTEKAEAKVTSTAIHNANSNILYSAPIVEMNNPFEVDKLSTLEVNTDGCKVECLEDPNPCEKECGSGYDTEVNDKGIRYIRHEVVLTFPDDLFITFDPNDIIITVGSSQTNPGAQYFLPDVLAPFSIPNGPLQNGILKRCLCDDNIFFYRNESLIFEEGGIQQTNRAVGGVKEEGGSFSLNYIIDYAETPFDNQDFIDSSTNEIREKAAQEGNGKIIAFLDSGIRPKFMPNNSLYFNEDPSTFVCSLIDPAGWNFVGENDNLNDDRGHGTLTSLAYMAAYENVMDNSEAIFSQRLLTVKILDACGEGSLYNALCGLKYAQAKGAEIINCSWGLYQPDRNLQRVIEEIANSSDIQIICSAGNAGIGLKEDTHFPSGYSREYLRFIDEEREEIGKPIDGMWEVGGICREVMATCGSQPINLPLSNSSNFSNSMFVEASKDVQRLLPEGNQPSCQIEGTSYAAPIFTASLTSFIIKAGGTIPTYQNIQESSKSIHPNFNYRSHYFANCN